MRDRKLIFKGLWLCSTGLERDVKEQVRKMIVACGGHFQDDLDVETTTHLIANAVGSLKHRTAVAYELIVVSPCWVFESFRAQKLLKVQDFSLKLLEGMGLCTSGLTVEEKETVEQLATSHGAQYDGRLELGFTSVLIAQHPEGAKYEAAVANHIPVVHLGWLYACLERQILVEEEEFALQSEMDQPSLQPNNIALNQWKKAQELVAALPEYVRKYRRRHHEDCKDLDVIDKEDDEEWMNLFDGCVLYLLGFAPQMNSLLQRLIRTGMGTIFHNVVVRQVTHVVVSASLSDKQTLDAIRARVIASSAVKEVHFVSASWLLDCVTCMDLQPEALYPVEFDVHVFETDHQTGDHVVSVIGGSSPPVAVEQGHVEVKNKVSLDPLALAEDMLQNEDGKSILTTSKVMQLSSKGKRRSIFAGYSFLLLCQDPEDQHMIKPMLKNIRGERGGAEAIAIAAIDFPRLDPEQFSFLSHVVVCTGVVMNEQDALKMQERIHQFQRNLRNTDEDNAEVVDRPQKRMRHNRKPRQRMLQFVSDLWVNCSLAARTKLSFSSHKLFGVSANYPRALFTNPVPLPGFQDVVVSTSVYRGIEQLVVVELLRIAGATVTTTLSTQNTHLVCLIPFGMKYDKATKRGIHVVRARWVVDSLVAGKRLNEEISDFQVVEGHESSSFIHIVSENATQSVSPFRSASSDG
ncbi:unnamed protein product [Peronospora farinosa]|uniref:BRCT domain-containing protein n=1 Tax=Peronospora farinosa TaxID=134698 RepID=A0AAV0SN31_9STRA|nr:unnamed protein product [Peronospora farinosa]CAI5704078.1 unnamed protein product [Peronospora farinosa]